MKCPHCKQEIKNDLVNTVGVICTMIFFFALGGSVVSSFGLSDLYYEQWIDGYTWGFVFVEIFPRIISLVALASGIMTILWVITNTLEARAR